MAQMCHWIVTNITLSSSAAEGEEYVLTPMFDELMSYVPPSPPPKTGYHRYVFALLAPSSSITTAAIDTSSTTITANGLDLKKPKDRPHWGYGKVGKGVRDWAEENKLTVVGANFFYAENEKQ
ncbi:hypothetical protein MMC08_000392 [Hypocenomyce scalaris]|nr:hypothetical protein [Hypocenomyce scalaris]